MDPLYPVLFNTSVLIAVTALHIYWLFGGKTGLEFAIPNYTPSRKRYNNLNKFKLFFATVLFASMSLFNIEQAEIINGIFYDDFMHWGHRIIAVIFLFRSIGNFKFIGFTKTFKGTTFAKLDTYIYSPVCLLLSIFSLIMSLD